MTIPTEQRISTLHPEGFLTNYVIAPQICKDDRQLPSGVTIVDIFNSELEAKNAVLKMHHRGLRADQIAIVAQDYQELGNCLNWQYIKGVGGLTVVLIKLGISIHATLQFVDAIADGKFLLVAVTVGKLVGTSPLYKTLNITFNY